MNFLPSSEPIFSLPRSYPYEYRYTTEKGVNFYVKSTKFEQDYPLDSQQRAALEDKVEREYVSILSGNTSRFCHRIVGLSCRDNSGVLSGKLLTVKCLTNFGLGLQQQLDKLNSVLVLALLAQHNLEEEEEQMEAAKIPISWDLDPDRVIGILDWELSTLGNQMCDVAYSCMGKAWPANKWKFYVAFGMFRAASIYAGVHSRWIMGNASGGERARNTGTLANTAHFYVKHLPFKMDCIYIFVEGSRQEV